MQTQTAQTIQTPNYPPESIDIVDSHQEDCSIDLSLDDVARVSPWYWADNGGLRLQMSAFQTQGHEYQIEPLDSEARQRVYRKGARLGFTEIEVIKTLHGQIFDRLPAGTLYLFPSANDVSEFSKARFGPLIADNYNLVGKHIADTDATTIKRIKKSLLYLRGARATTKVEGVKEDSSQLRSIGVDKVVFDEVDLMDPKMIDLALVRMDYSEVKEEVYISTPTIPDFGIDKKYQESDQRVWMIKCHHCGEWTCLELEFPECIDRDKNGRGIRLCRKCKREIFSCNGEWCAQVPGKDIVGYWISQLNLRTVDPYSILKLFLNPPNNNLQEVYNSKLGMAYISAENRLTPHELWELVTNEMMPYEHEGPTAMGVDVGNNFHITILDRPGENTLRVVKVIEIDSKGMDDFSPIEEVAKRFNVKCAVIDFAPVQKKVRAFREAVPFEVYGCIYQEHQRGPASWDVVNGIVRMNRTEICDITHDICTTTKAPRLIMPRRSTEVETWVQHMCNIAKVLEEDKETGAKEYFYRKLGADHYRHSLNYAWLAAQRIGVYTPSKKGKNMGNWRGNDSGSWRAL